MIQRIPRRGFLQFLLGATVAITGNRMGPQSVEDKSTRILRKVITTMISIDDVFLPPLPQLLPNIDEDYQHIRLSLLRKIGIGQSVGRGEGTDLLRLAGNLREAISWEYREGHFGWREGWSVSNTESQLLSFIARDQHLRLSVNT